jgi:flagellum-specific ATP synthase
MSAPSSWAAERHARLRHGLLTRAAVLAQAPLLTVEGRLRRVTGLTLEAVGCTAEIGTRCRIGSDGGASVEAEVVGFAGDRSFLMPIGELTGIAPNARVTPLRRAAEVSIGDDWLGRVVDGEGEPLDARPRPRGSARVTLKGRRINPFDRAPVREPLDVGVRAINALLTVGRGQRLGLFAGTGVGKSTLLGMMTRNTAADVIVVGLIGERGREVRDFVEQALGPEGLARACVVATPADRSPLQRLNGAALATSVAEYFRDRGRNVLLLMDSLTRFAQAQREIGLAVGEPPTTRGYPPSVFARLPELVERAGNAEPGKGSITAFYTVLTEGDDPQDPIADAARGILDGHFVLSRQVAESGIYPALDIESSISRVAQDCTDAAQQADVRKLRGLMGAYRRNRDLINIGAYQRGSDARTDAAIALWPRIEAFLRQDVGAGAGFAESVAALHALTETPTP